VTLIHSKIEVQQSSSIYSKDNGLMVRKWQFTRKYKSSLNMCYWHQKV